jgi:hypothetical protein
MPPVGFEPTIPASARPQTCALRQVEQVQIFILYFFKYKYEHYFK